MTQYDKPADKTSEAAVERPRIESVVHDGAIKEKGRLWRKLFAGRDAKSAAIYVASDVIVPALKNLAFDTLMNMGSQVIFGRPHQGGRPTTPGLPAGQFNYRSPFEQARPAHPAMNAPAAHLPGQPGLGYTQNRREVSDMVFSSRTDAEAVLESMRDICDQYQFVTLGDFYALTGLPGSPVDEKFGWVELGSAQVFQSRAGFTLALPPMGTLT